MIDKQQALDLLDRAVHQDGYGEDYVYKSHYIDCNYTRPNGNPQCLVGHALFLGGVNIQGLDDAKDEDNDPIDTDISTLSKYKKVSLSGGAVSIFAAAQFVQDTGGTWGEALDAARKV